MIKQKSLTAEVVLTNGKSLFLLSSAIPETALSHSTSQEMTFHYGGINSSYRGFGVGVGVVEWLLRAMVQNNLCHRSFVGSNPTLFTTDAVRHFWLFPLH